MRPTRTSLESSLVWSQLLCKAVSTNEDSKYIEKTIKLLNKNPRKMNQKHHQKKYFYFIYKSPGTMLVNTLGTMFGDL